MSTRFVIPAKKSARRGRTSSSKTVPTPAATATSSKLEKRKALPIASKPVLLAPLPFVSITGTKPYRDRHPPDCDICRFVRGATHGRMQRCRWCADAALGEETYGVPRAKRKYSKKIRPSATTT